MSGWKDYCNSYCSTSTPSPGFEPYCPQMCNNTNCPDCLYKWETPPVQAPVQPPVQPAASGWKDYCNNYCSTSKPSPGFEPYCPQMCNNTNCPDCLFKGPWDSPVQAPVQQPVQALVPVQQPVPVQALVPVQQPVPVQALVPVQAPFKTQVQTPHNEQVNSNLIYITIGIIVGILLIISSCIIILSNSK